MTKTIRESFPQRLVRIRKAKGFTQMDLAKVSGISNRMIAHYETRVKSPALDNVIKLAKVLSVSMDELTGYARDKEVVVPNNIRLAKKLKVVEMLPHADQRRVIDFIDALQARQEARKIKKRI